MHSAVHLGKQRQRRFSPREHQFTHPVFVAFLDIDELPRLMRVSPSGAWSPNPPYSLGTSGNTVTVSLPAASAALVHAQ